MNNKLTNKMNKRIITAVELTDGYKLGHRNQYPVGTEYVYANWTPRSGSHYPEAKEGAVVFGIQQMVKELKEVFDTSFFNYTKEEVITSYQRRINCFLGPNDVGTLHIEALYDLGYLPLEIKALPEGNMCPFGVPMMTVINTHPDFFWLVNYLETWFSNQLWLPMTSATTARLFKKELKRHADLTGFPEELVIEFLCHDFSMRGMGLIGATIGSGMGHLTSFYGSESIPAIGAIEHYYNTDVEKELVAATIPATEHSVMCAGKKESEIDTFKRLLTEVYPKGFLSIVSDTWDYWQVITEYLPQLKDIIEAREGRLVVRPDSGDPVDIICGRVRNLSGRLADNGKYYSLKQAYSERDMLYYSEVDHEITEAEYKGTYELLWDIFGGTTNEKGYKVLSDKIGIIYGDAITLERQAEIYKRLEAKGFAATNLVLGIGLK